MSQPSSKAIVIPSKGLGDALIMMISAFYCFNQGLKVTVYHDILVQLKALFPYATICPRAELNLSAEKQENPWILLQYGNTPGDFSLSQKLRKLGIKTSIIYGEFNHVKHPPFTPCDYLLPSNQTMAESVNKAMMDLLQVDNLHCNNGIALKVAKKQTHHVCIHPTSTDPNRNYPPEKFTSIAKLLLSQGIKVTFCMHPSERDDWLTSIPQGAQLPILPSLLDTAFLLAGSSLLIGNDSGLAHLASNLGLCSIVFSKDWRHIRRWKPGFTPSKALTPARWIPNIKPWRLRQTYWHTFIPPKKVAKIALTSLRQL